ncbi:MAG: hypothetical protein WB764_09985 [Xanthobacteraceae bacterium]
MQTVTIWPAPFTRISIAALVKWIALSTFATVALGVTTPAVAEDRMVLGPRQFETDKQGGAVLCAWSIYLSVRTQTTACAFPPHPVDAVIDEAIAAIDEFIIANSSLHPTPAMLEDFKHRAAEADLRFARQAGMQKYCENNLLCTFGACLQMKSGHR